MSYLCIGHHSKGVYLLSSFYIHYRFLGEGAGNSFSSPDWGFIGKSFVNLGA